jgi:hypothetical protein
VATTISGVRYDTVEQMRQRVAELDAEYPGRLFPDDAREEWNYLDDAIAELETRHSRLVEMARSPYAREDGATFGTPYRTRTADTGHPAAQEARSGALRTLERYNNSGELTSGCGRHDGPPRPRHPRPDGHHCQVPRGGG